MRRVYELVQVNVVLPPAVTAVTRLSFKVWVPVRTQTACGG